MKTYRNDELGFEIDIPKKWLFPIKVASDSIILYNTQDETMNIVVGPLQPERLPDYLEYEFQQYARQKKYDNLKFGRIHVEGKDHVWAKYQIGDGRLAKKYMIVFGGIEYAITSLCSKKSMFVERENTWDEIVKSFRLSILHKKAASFIDEVRSETAGELYSKAYDAASKGQYSEACTLLKQCLSENPNHILAHKEIAFILKNTGNVKDALFHRQKVKELNPKDKVNCFNLAGIYAMLGEKESAIQEINELISMEPENLMFQEFKKEIMNFIP